MLVTASLAAGSLFGYVGYTKPAFANGSTCSVQGNVGTVSGGNNAALVQSMTDCIADLSSGGVIDFDDNDVDETTVINVTTPFVIDKSLTIQGSSTTDEVWPVFDGGKTGTPGSYSGSRIFVSSMGSSEQVTLKEIGLQNGFDTHFGGAVDFKSSAKLVLDSVKVGGNTAGDVGGAVSSMGEVSVQSTADYTSKFIDNKALQGGGGAIFGAVKVSATDAIFSSNKAVNTDYTNFCPGGAIASGAVYINNSDFDNNQAVLGGAVWTIKDSVIKNSDFISNYSSDEGGAVYLRGDFGFPDLEIENSYFKLNSTDNSGGAVYARYDSKLSVSDSNFVENYAGDEGGAIGGKDRVSLTVSGTTFTDNEADTRGGAVYLDDGVTLQISNSSFDINQAEYGGAVYVSNDAALDITQTSFTSNKTSDRGGAIFSYYRADMNISDSFFAENYADGRGGAIYGYDDSDMDIHNSVFYSNISGSDGGAIAADNGSDLLVSNTTFYKNSASESAVLYIRGDATIEFSTLYQNYSTDETNVIESGGLIISNSVIGSNPESDKTPVTGLDVEAPLFAFDNTDYVNFSLLSADGDLKLEAVVVDEVFSHLLPGADSPLVGVSDPSPTLASDSPLRKDQLGNDRTFPSNIGAISTVGAAQSSPPSFSAPVPTTSPILNLEESKPFSQGETVVARVSNATRVESILIGDTEAEIISFEDGLLSFTVPELEAGSYSITGEFNSGTVIFDVGLEITAQTVSAAQALNVWTKKVSDTEAKVYAKNPIGNGKIQFFVDGEEIAWVRAEDETDSKLRQAQGAYYLVRTVELTDSKQAIEIFVDGVRAWRAAETAN